MKFTMSIQVLSLYFNESDIFYIEIALDLYAVSLKLVIFYHIRQYKAYSFPKPQLYYSWQPDGIHSIFNFNSFPKRKQMLLPWAIQWYVFCCSMVHDWIRCIINSGKILRKSENQKNLSKWIMSCAVFYRQLPNIFMSGNCSIYLENGK